MKHNWNIDVPVLLIFFARSDTFAKVFEEVRKARPKTLLLWQDGPRQNRPDDVKGIEECRKIAQNIDWECDVYRMYNEVNYGCDPSIFYAYKWAMTHVDRCIFLEDDQVPCQSFFPFCKELLDKYENDTRISHICGYNYTEIAPDCDADYLFATSGSGAWATWKRVSDMWDGSYGFLDDAHTIENVSIQYGDLAKSALVTAYGRRATGKEFWETIIGCNCMFNNMLAIIPKKNLVSNHGLTPNSTHSNSVKKHLPKVTRNLFEMKTYELEFPLKHPKFVIENKAYRKKVNLIMGIGHPFRRKWRTLVYLFRKYVLR